MHSLISFLDRFVHRNPKKPAVGLRGASIMQPHAIVAGVDLLVSAQSQTQKVLLPCAKLNAGLVEHTEAAPDEAFFHQYFDTRFRSRDKSRKGSTKRHEASSTTDDLTREPGKDEEDAIWKALVDSRPDIEGDSEDDFDLDDDTDLDLAMGEHVDGAEMLSDGQSSISDEESEDAGLFDNESDHLESGNEENEANVLPGGNILRQVRGSEQDPKARRKGRKMLRGLPTFASAEDYEEVLKEVGVEVPFE